MFKFNNRYTTIRCETYSMLTIKTPERRQWRRYDVWLICTYGKTKVQIIPPDDELKLRKNIVYDILRFSEKIGMC